MVRKMKETLSKRKPTRLKKYDYSTEGAYFITICTKDKKHLFGPVGADSISARMIKQTFTETIKQFDGIEAPIFVVMPNHLHAIITISRADMESAPTISHVIQAFKRYSTIQYIKLVQKGKAVPFEKQIWQRSFYDHIIRNQQDYDEIYNYIVNNPAKWKLDKLFVEKE